MNFLSKSILYAFFLTFFLNVMSCSSGSGVTNTIIEEDDDVELFIDNAQVLSNALSFVGGEKKSGSIPSPGEAEHDINGPEQYVITQNSSGELRFGIELPDNRSAGAVFLKLEGADDYHIIPVETDGTASQSISMKGTGIYPSGSVAAAMNQDVGIKAYPMQNHKFPDEELVVNADVQIYIPPQGQSCCAQLFDDNWAGRLNPDNWTRSIPVKFRGMNVGEGVIQVTLTWDAAVDLDLHIIEPNDFEIYYAQPQSPYTGGFLDYDDIEGYGPENIFYEEMPAAGTYSVKVNYFSGNVATNYNLTLNRNGNVSTFSGRLTNSDEHDMVTTFQGGN